jgi:CRISPR/Cas system CMR-associated protein Cmr3 (group 5 of RAMP superfamily)
LKNRVDLIKILFRLSVRTRVKLQKLINYDPKKDKPIFAQHHSAQMVHKDDDRIDEDDLVQRQKLLAKEPEVPEMLVDKKKISNNIQINILSI